MKKNGGLLLGIILLGLVLRLLFVSSRNIQYDDMFSYFLATKNLGEIIKGTAADTMPPLYYFLLHFWLLINREIWFLRLLSVLLSLGIIVSLYLLINKISNEMAALWAAFLAAISPLQIYHAQDIRMYVLLALLVILYFYFIISLIQVDAHDHKRQLYSFGAIICGIGAMYTHNLAIFGIIAPDFYFLVKLDWTKLRTLILIQIFIGLFSIPWLVILPGQMQKIQAAFWTPKPGIVEVFQFIILLTSHLPLTPSWLLFVCSLLSIEGFMLVFFIAWKYKKEMPLVQLLLILVLGPPITLFMISYLARPVFVSRVFIYSATMFLGIAGIAIAKGWNKRIGLVLASLFVLNSALSLPSLYSYSEFPRSPYKEAANFLATNEDSNLRIIHDNKLSYFPMHYYLPDRDQVFLADEPGSSNDTFAVASQQAMEIFPVNNIEDAVNGSKRIAFVVFSSAIEEYNERGMDQHPILKWLNDEFNFQEKTTFNDLEIYFFDR